VAVPLRERRSFGVSSGNTGELTRRLLNRLGQLHHRTSPSAFDLSDLTCAAKRLSIPIIWVSRERGGCADIPIKASILCSLYHQLFGDLEPIAVVVIANNHGFEIAEATP
jgi:hypothetical protein